MSLKVTGLCRKIDINENFQLHCLYKFGIDCLSDFEVGSRSDDFVGICLSLEAYSVNTIREYSWPYAGKLRLWSFN